MLDDNGDIVIENNEIQMVYDVEFYQQIVKTMLATKKEEWFFDIGQGADRSAFIGKNVTADGMRDEIENVLLQIDETFTITAFESDINTTTRKATVKFQAETNSGIKINIEL